MFFFESLSIFTKQFYTKSFPKEVEQPCKYANEGCVQVLANKDLQRHQSRCYYRQVPCLDAMCKDFKFTFNLSSWRQHCLDYHGDSDIQLMNAKSKEIDLEIEATDTVILVNAMPQYFFYPNIEMEQIFDETNANFSKACLVSTMSPQEAKKYKCIIILNCDGKDVVYHEGMVFSIDEVRNLRKQLTGGMIYSNFLPALQKCQKYNKEVVFKIQTYRIDQCTYY